MKAEEPATLPVKLFIIIEAKKMKRKCPTNIWGFLHPLFSMLYRHTVQYRCKYSTVQNCTVLYSKTPIPRVPGTRTRAGK
jgi:hypothetical protein